MKLSMADINFGKCVKAAQNYTCERCGRQSELGSKGMHTSHIFSRRHRTIRWCGGGTPTNAQCLCFQCHDWFGGNPADSGKWVTEMYGEGAMDLLREKRDNKVKITKEEEKAIARHYKLQLAIIEEKRANGEQGVIPFESYQ